jgi:hypothetical protein
MEGNNEKTCANCGSPVKEGAAFCTKCGAAQAAPVEGAAAAPGAGVPGAPMPAAAPMAPAKRSKAPMIIGIVGGALVLCAIAVLVLWLAVWRDGGGGAAGSDDPIGLAEKYIQSLEKGDIDSYMECFEGDFFVDEMKNNPFLEEMGLTEDDIKEYAEMAFEMMEVDFKEYALELESETKDKATVVTTSGTVVVSVFGMEEEVDLADDPLEFNMVKKDGRWYLVENPMGMTMGTDMDFDMEDIVPEDLNLEDLENLLPEDLNIEDLENLLPEDLNLEDLNVEDLDQLLEELERLMEDMPQGQGTSA